MKIPNQLKENPFNNQLDVLENWWVALDAKEKELLSKLYDEKINPDELKIEFCGEFVSDEELNENPFWEVGGLYEYLVNHELDFTIWTHHLGGTCTAHQKAIDAGKKGVLKSDFACPFKDKDCPMRKILSISPGKTFLFYAKLKHLNQ